MSLLQIICIDLFCFHSAEANGNHLSPDLSQWIWKTTIPFIRPAEGVSQCADVSNRKEMFHFRQGKAQLRIVLILVLAGVPWLSCEQLQTSHRNAPAAGLLL